MQAHRVHTCCVHVVCQLYRLLHLHVGLEDAAAERSQLIVGFMILMEIKEFISVQEVEHIIKDMVRQEQI